MSVTTTALNTEMGSVICPTSPFMSDTLLGVLEFWLSEVVTGHKFEESVTEQSGLIMGHEHIKKGQEQTVTDADDAQPYLSNDSLNSNCSIFLSLPDDFLWPSKPLFLHMQ